MHFYLYENEDSKCTSNVVKIKSNDFCSSKFSELIKGINATIQVVNGFSFKNNEISPVFSSILMSVSHQLGSMTSLLTVQYFQH